MRKGIVVVLIGMGIHLGLLAAYEYLYFERTRNFRIVENFRSAEFENVFVGDSHCNFAIDPRIVENSFNLCFPGTSYFHILNLLKTVLLEKSSIKRVIIEVDENMFANYKRESIEEDLPFWSQYIQFDEIPDSLLDRKARLKLHIAGRWFPYVSTGGDMVLNAIKLIRGKDFQTQLVGGFLVKDGDFSSFDVQKQEKLARDRSRNHFESSLGSIDLLMKDQFAQIVELLRVNHIEIQVVRLPVSETYLKYAEDWKIGNMADEIETFLNELRVSRWDLRDQKWTKSDFRDSDHVNVKGSVRVSHLLNEKLNH